MKKPYVWPSRFAYAVEQFLIYIEAAGYSKDYVRGLIRVTHDVLMFLDRQGTKDCAAITTKDIMAYITKRCAHLSVSGLKTHIGRVRSFLKFIYLNELNPCDIPSELPAVRQYELAQIPVVWQNDNVSSMMSAINRSTAEGKRDYAIFMLAINVGLRIGDILHLRFQNVDWAKSIIQISQVITDELLSLTMSKELGWALIDYIKYGRPKTDAPFIFVRHCAPFQAFCINNNFHYQIRKYAALAGVNPPSTRLYGMHSLRHTFATNLLKEGAPLTTIAELLGHRGVSSTPVYLKVDDEQLRMCALDPEIEVLSNE